MLALRRVLNDTNRCQDVVSHRLIFCERAEHMPTEHLLLDCWCCNRFFVFCCACTERQRLVVETLRQFGDDVHSDDEAPPRLCHYYKVAFVDGACLGNGKDGAKAGIGIAIGVNHLTMQWAIPVDDDIDPAPVRTSQRAELLAAIHGLSKLAESEDRTQKPGVHKDSDNMITWVITSDSEYVVSGITEWAPTWKNNGWRNSSGKRPKNLDLFQSLNAAVERYEREYHVRVAFWRINRRHNELADELAGIAAKGNIVEPVEFEPMYPQSDDEMATY
ncbi:ribonuclease H-like domain-containing protein [Chiua virens]|nr:ribonuclease H-like domain-containing protein [Chiua virens]